MTSLEEFVLIVGYFALGWVVGRTLAHVVAHFMKRDHE